MSITREFFKQIIRCSAVDACSDLLRTECSSSSIQTLEHGLIRVIYRKRRIDTVAWVLV